MEKLRVVVVAQSRRLARVWHTDFTDPIEMRRLRARVMAAAALLGLVSTLGGAVAARPATGSFWAVPAAIVTYLLCLIGWTRRGARAGDTEFLLMILVSHVFGMVSVLVGIGRGQVSVTALSLVSVALMGGVFCGRRSDVVVQALFGSAMIALSGVLGAGGPHWPQEVSTGAFDLIAVSAVVRLLRDMAVAAVERAKHGEVTDPLTGLANRRGLEQQGARSWSTRARERAPLAVLVIDVDHFKRVNDSQGHAAGDEILRRLADLIAANMRHEDDVTVRLGGEEFFVLCAVTPGEAVHIAERLREQVEAELAPVTISIGVHEMLPGADDPLPDSLWTAVDVADRALYVAKNGGRNRVVLALPA
ncbi:diguanylate cyclase [Kineosporia sp. A_224]|uniref:GGDEF domain-containing protein n=1 Tax=Kineosporia sp. A_224 TaxID=1962180 RepID=UPI00117A08B7|nr:GGDEF domain-containing protein [Kineosporia sp. A_224]